LVQIFSSAPCSQTPSVRVPLLSGTLHRITTVDIKTVFYPEDGSNSLLPDDASVYQATNRYN
jgi:hypothetical protein